MIGTGGLGARSALLTGVLALSGCGAGTSGGGVEVSDAELTAAAAAVCAALDQVGAERATAVATFQNDAHDRLHALAAAPGLDRSSAARLLEAKARVEAAIAGDVPSGELRRYLAELVAATELALTNLGLEPPHCEGAA